MVRLEEVPDEEFLAQQAREQARAASSSRTVAFDDDEDNWEEDDEDSDAESDISDVSEVSERGLALKEESVWERIAALKDIIPPSTRRNISSTFSTTSSYAVQGSLLLGKLGWIVTTSALLIGLPFALAVEDESRIVAQEKDMMSQGQGPQHMMAPAAPGQQQQAPGGQGLRPPGF